MILIVIFLVVVAITVMLGFVLHRGRGSMPSGESEIDLDHEFRLRFGPPFHFPGGGEADFPSYPFQLFHIALSPPEECIICRSRYQPHHQVIILPRCGHVFHAHCIRSWLAEARSNQSCPLCRRVVNGVSSIIETTSSSDTDTFSSSVGIAGSYTSHQLPVFAYEEQPDDEVASVASSETPPPSNQGNLFNIENHAPEPVMVKVGYFSRCLGFIRANKKLRARRVTGLGHESDLVGLGCFSRCMRFINLKKFRAHGGSGQSDTSVGVRFLPACCFKFNKPKKY